MNRLFSLVLTAALLLAGCGALLALPASETSQSTPAPAVLTVYAAASLTDAFTEMGSRFETLQPDVTVNFNFAGSQTLRTQIQQGAQVDVFASANVHEMDALVRDGSVSAGSPRLFLSNRLVVIMPAQNPAGLTRLEDLAQSGLKLVIAAAEVPIGAYSLQALEKLDQAFGDRYKDKVLENVVSYENDVKQVVAKVQLGEADAGIVYTSDSAAAPELLKIDIPLEYNVPASYPIAALAGSQSPELARAFTDYVLSPPGQAILHKWGFQPVEN